MFEIFWLWNLIKTARVPTFEDASSYHGDFHNLLTFYILSEWPCMFEGRRVNLEEYCDFYLSWAIIFWHRTFRLNQWRINAIPARPSLVPYSSVLLRCFFSSLIFLPWIFTQILLKTSFGISPFLGFPSLDNWNLPSSITLWHFVFFSWVSLVLL